MESNVIGRMKAALKVSGLAMMLAGMAPANSADVVTSKNIGMELANEIAMQSVLTCREQGYQVSAVVVDRFGILRSAMRDDLAAKFTLQIAEEKANMVVFSGLKSGQFRKLRSDIRPELNHIEGLIVMTGAVPIMAAGVRIGAVGVSGAPGGEKDEVCAMKAIEKIQDRLDFQE